MIPPSFHIKALIIAVVSVIIAPFSQSQGFSHYGQNPRGFCNSNPVIVAAPSDDIEKNIYAIDNLADQMAFRFGWEMKFGKDLSKSNELYRQMKSYTETTNELIKSYRGRNGISFHDSLHEVQQSLSRIRNLRKSTRVSETVNQMITQSIPLVERIAEQAIPAIVKTD